MLTQRTLILNGLLSLSPIELNELAMLYTEFRALNPEQRDALLERVEAFSRTHARKIREIHRAEGASLKRNRKRYAAIFGSNEHQPAPGYLLATACRTRGLEVWPYEELRQNLQSSQDSLVS
ncbi:MAG: hypothetical protein ABIH92_03085 [Nanoarchaeota archaeon]